MADKITPNQFIILDWFEKCPGGKSHFTPAIWRDRNHQALLKRGLLRLRADPFTTRASQLRGQITARGCRVVRGATEKTRALAKKIEDRDYERWSVAEQES